MFYDVLYKQGRTPSDVFSFYMADDAGDARQQSSIEFGGYNNNYFKNSSERG